MSTRCNIHFNHGSEIAAILYQHCDGYPGQVNTPDSGILPDLRQFFSDVAAQTADGMGGTRFDDPCYLAAKFIVWRAAHFAHDKAKPLDFISLGVMLEDAGDAAYIYSIDCSKHDAKGYPKVTYKAAH